MTRKQSLSHILIAEKEEPSLVKLNSSKIERRKNDFSDCDFIDKTLAVCNTINVELDSIKSDLAIKLKIRKEKVVNDKAELRILQPPVAEAANRHQQSFWKRYSGQKMDPASQKLALKFDASKTKDSVHSTKANETSAESIPISSDQVWNAW